MWLVLFKILSNQTVQSQKMSNQSMSNRSLSNRSRSNLCRPQPQLQPNYQLLPCSAEPPATNIWYVSSSNKQYIGIPGQDCGLDHGRSVVFACLGGLFAVAFLLTIVAFYSKIFLCLVVVALFVYVQMWKVQTYRYKISGKRLVFFFIHYSHAA